MALFDVYSFTAKFTGPFERGDVIVIGSCECHGDKHAAVWKLAGSRVSVIAGKWNWLTQATAAYLRITGKFRKGQQ